MGEPKLSAQNWSCDNILDSLNEDKSVKRIYSNFSVDMWVSLFQIVFQAAKRRQAQALMQH